MSYLDRVRLALGVLPVYTGQALPGWAETLRDIIQTASTFTTQTEPLAVPALRLPLDVADPLPFETVFLPALQVARKKLLELMDVDPLAPTAFPLDLLTEQAYLSLERDLLRRLTQICASSLQCAFDQTCPIGYKLLHTLIPDLPHAHKTVYYDAFVQQLLSDGLLTFFQQYPVLGRLVAVSVDFWVEATAEFLQALDADRLALQQAFAPRSLPQADYDPEHVQPPLSFGTVVAIKPGMSDLHHRGRCVLALTCESGLKLIFKPKDLGLEAAYTQLLDWCNRHDLPLPLRVLKVLNRQHYGWVEYVEQAACEDAAAARRFFQRAGMLLCLLYTLNGTDCHHENVIASDEHLVLIDMETLLQPDAKPIDDGPEAITLVHTVYQAFGDSVIRTGLLPYWLFSTDTRFVEDISGLGEVDAQAMIRQRTFWKAVNTDGMRLVHEIVLLPLPSHVAMLDGKVLSPHAYLNEIVDGFQQMYRFLVDQREALLAPGSPLTELSRQWVRFIFRATNIYGAILVRSLQPDVLRDGIDRSIELDLLSRAFLTGACKPDIWPILTTELRAMEQLDIPYFEVAADSCALMAERELLVEAYLQQSSIEKLLARLRGLDERDQAYQTMVIHGAFHARVAQSHGNISVATDGPPSSDDYADRPIAPLTRVQLIEEAYSIAQTIRARAITTADGSVTS